ncbi:MAG: hypothetical protein WA151_17695, partial [Desulfatirhabdiaceae bacterium]
GGCRFKYKMMSFDELYKINFRTALKKACGQDVQILRKRDSLSYASMTRFPVQRCIRYFSNLSVLFNIYISIKGGPNEK